MSSLLTRLPADPDIREFAGSEPLSAERQQINHITYYCTTDDDILGVLNSRPLGRRVVQHTGALVAGRGRPVSEELAVLLARAVLSTDWWVPLREFDIASDINVVGAALAGLEDFERLTSTSRMRVRDLVGEALADPVLVEQVAGRDDVDVPRLLVFNHQLGQALQRFDAQALAPVVFEALRRDMLPSIPKTLMAGDAGRFAAVCDLFTDEQVEVLQMFDCRTR